jgi:hypothetical protein
MLGDIDIRNVGMEDDILGSQARVGALTAEKPFRATRKGWSNAGIVS